jgi:signal transduction histidine kinase
MKGIQIEKHFKGFDNINYKVNTDQKRIQQIFLNIFSNAVKFTDRNGKIMILVEY